MMNDEQPSAIFRPAALLAGMPSPRAGHLPFAADLIGALQPSTIVELGVGYGDTYFGFCQLVNNQELACTCYGVDTWLRGNAIYDAVSRHNNARYRAFSHLIRKTFDNALHQFADGSITLLNLDGLQPYSALEHTFTTWLPKVHAGGVIMLNDISMRGGEPGAWRLWAEVKEAFPHFSFRNNNGLGVLGRTLEDVENIPFLEALFNASEEKQERIRRYYLLCSERLELAAQLGASGTSDVACSLFQVFRSEAGNYETSPELSHVLSPGAWVNLHLHLPQGIGDRPLRLDVANRPAVVDIATLVLRKADGQAAWTWNPKDATDVLEMAGSATRMPSPDFFRVLSLGASPQLLLPEFRGSAFDQPLDLEIRLKIDLELAAVSEMNQKWADLDKAKAGTAATDPAAVEAAVAKAKAEAARQLAQARLEHESKIKQLTADAEARLEAMRADFENQAAHTTLQLEEERRLHQATLVDRDQMIAHQPRMLQEISIAQGNTEDLKAELERVSAEHGSMEYDLIELRKLNARMAAALEEERSVRSTMQDSSSWQLTKPFRAVGDLFGPRKKY